ncbi:hypothetical protein F4819DRAFT_467607 [Hypoxylon fuscum]|nr:hypothetical protein F4819DRAFT_467607 [Hypoxylon fuscum]
MHAIMLLSLLAGQTASKALKYVVPATLAATDCTYPANFTVTNFTTYTDSVDIAKNYTSFHYADVGTGIDTFCNRNSSSKPSTIGSGNQWPCDNQDVTFIYQPTGWNVALTLAEIACPAK